MRRVNNASASSNSRIDSADVGLGQQVLEPLLGLLEAAGQQVGQVHMPNLGAALDGPALGELVHGRRDALPAVHRQGERLDHRAGLRVSGDVVVAYPAPVQDVGDDEAVGGVREPQLDLLLQARAGRPDVEGEVGADAAMQRHRNGVRATGQLVDPSRSVPVRDDVRGAPQW